MLQVKKWFKAKHDPMQAFRENFNLEDEPHNSSIPHIIHQSYKTKKLEPYQQEWQKSWLQTHPNWTYMFWTDKDNRALIADKFPWFLSTYDHLPHAIQRADCARYFYMLHFGGCYFDLDFESLKPLEPLLAGVQVALGYMSKNKDGPLSIPNAFAASVPGHQFWYFVIKQILKAWESSEISSADIFSTTGPIMLKNAVADYQATAISKDLTLLPPEKIYGLDWDWRGVPSMRHVFAACHAASKSFNATQCKAFFPEAYAITYWSGDLTWTRA